MTPEVIATVAQTMRRSPLAFGLVVLNVLWMALLVWFAVALHDRNNKERAYLQERAERCELRPGGR